ncbi:MAG TPA: CAP domain-containing protein [Planctomycetota bacterium]|nr:CAP domain-containing protein [Planctomycetota bacterium]
MRTKAALLGLAFMLGCSHSRNGSGGDASTTTPGSTTPTSTGGVSTTPRTTTTPTTTPPVSNCLTSSPADPNVAYLLNLLNADRAQHGSPPLVLDECMSKCSYQHSVDLANCVAAGGALGSSGPNSSGTGCAHLDFRNGNTCGATEENQGVALETSVQADLDTINSDMMAEGIPTNGTTNHCTNIVNPSMTAVGIGLYQDAQGYLWVTEDFR